MSRAPARGGRLRRLIRKELREILRDRRTVFTLVLMPVLVYPMLNLVFQRFLLSSLVAEDQPPTAVVAFQSPGDARLVLGTLAAGWQAERELGLRPKQEEDAQRRQINGAGQIDARVFEDPESALKSLQVDLAVRIRKRPPGPLRLELLHRSDSPNSREVLERVESSLRALNERFYRQSLRRAGRPSAPPARAERVTVATAGTVGTLGTLVPLILIMMTVTGAVYPAIDLTAGERERATLETLFAAPVSRFGLLLAKYTAVVAVALLTAVVNLTAMTATLYAGGLAKLVFGDQGLTPASILTVFLLLVLFAAFFSAVLLMITSSARSFKEAQAYLIPLMLVSLGPGLISLLPGMELTFWLAITPLLNVVLLARDIFQGAPLGLLGLVALGSTLGYTLAAIWAAGRVFGQDAVVQAGSARFDRRPRGRWTAPTPAVASLCLAFLVPAYYFAGGWLAQLQGVRMSVRLMLSAVVTGVIFGAVPWMACIWERVPVRLGMRLRRAPWLAWPAAAILGVSLWPLAHEIILLGERLGAYSLDLGRLEQVQQMLDKWRQLSPQLLVVCLALAPAVFEELLFRGYLFRAWEQRLRPATLIVCSALLFGAFHVVSGHTLTPERFLPSTLIGLALGWTAVRTGSVLPGILLHFANNSLLILVAYYQQELTARGWDVSDQDRLPVGWLAASSVAIVVGLGLLGMVRMNHEHAKDTKGDRAEDNERMTDDN